MMQEFTARHCASLLLLAVLGATGCATASTYSAQVVSCTDKKPVPEAKLSYRAADGTAASTENEMPQLTGDDGRVKAEVLDTRGSTLLMTVDKPGYERKEVPITTGRDQTICLNPVPMQSAK